MLSCLPCGQGCACHLYLDLEYLKGPNPAADSEALMEALLRLLSTALQEHLGMALREDALVELDSSTDGERGDRVGDTVESVKWSWSRDDWKLRGPQGPGRSERLRSLPAVCAQRSFPGISLRLFRGMASRAMPTWGHSSRRSVHSSSRDHQCHHLSSFLIFPPIEQPQCHLICKLESPSLAPSFSQLG